MSTWLMLDGDYLCHRAMATTGYLSHDGVGTGVLFGFLRTMDSLRDRFGTDRFVFAFDWGCEKRREIYPDYKRNRHVADPTEEQKELWTDYRRQVRHLRDRDLRALGYRNVFRQRGYEADDVLASLSFSLPDGDDAIVVSSDSDLWQLLTDRVSCFDPHRGKLRNDASFEAEWGIRPAMWTHVKAIAGCPGDGVPGIRGVGPKTAARWYAGTLKPGSVAYRKIEEQGPAVHARNYELVRLPFPGVDEFRLRDDETSDGKRRELLKSLGFRGRSVGRTETIKDVPTGGLFGGAM